MFGLFGAVLVLSIISLSKKDSAENSVEAMRDENKAEKIADICCSSERFLESIQILLKEWENYGLFN